ncbi:type II toxin-antitoxin system ParD family antitoxin [Halioxenophilus aromaticivorans]
MATMNIALPDPIRDWVESQIDSVLYANNSVYIRDLIRKDQRRADKIKALQASIDEGFASGDDGELDIEAIKQEARLR